MRLRAQRSDHPVAQECHAAPQQEEPHGERRRRRVVGVGYLEGADVVRLAQQLSQPPHVPPKRTLALLVTPLLCRGRAVTQPLEKLLQRRHALLAGHL